MYQCSPNIMSSRWVQLRDEETQEPISDEKSEIKGSEVCKREEQGQYNNKWRKHVCTPVYFMYF